MLSILILAAITMSASTTQPAHDVKIAVCQVLCIESDRSGNFARIERALRQARASGAEIACFPESVLLGWENPEAHQLAEPIPGKDSEHIAKLARRYEIMIAIGLDEKDGDRLYGSAILVDRDGRILLKHRKINVLAELMEPPYSTGSPDQIQAADTRLGRIGVLICADTFTEEHLARMQALEPDLVLVPYGWAAKKSEWPKHARELEKLVRKLGKRWQCPVVGTDLVGAITQGPWAGRTYGGASVVADAEGKATAVLADRDVDVRVVDVSIAERSAPRTAPAP